MNENINVCQVYSRIRQAMAYTSCIVFLLSTYVNPCLTYYLFVRDGPIFQKLFPKTQDISQKLPDLHQKIKPLH